MKLVGLTDNVKKIAGGGFFPKYGHILPALVLSQEELRVLGVRWPYCQYVLILNLMVDIEFDDQCGVFD